MSLDALEYVTLACTVCLTACIVLRVHVLRAAENQAITEGCRSLQQA